MADRPGVTIPSHEDVYNDAPQQKTSFFKSSSQYHSGRSEETFSITEAQPSERAREASGAAVFPNGRPPLSLGQKVERNKASGSSQNEERERLGDPSNSSDCLRGNAENISAFTETFAFVKNSKFYEATAPVAQNPAVASTSGSVPLTRPVASSSSSLATLQHQNRNAIIVSKRQQGNPVLKHIRNVRWLFGEIVPDYILGAAACALYISLRYHLLHPNYLYFRIRELQKSYRLRVVLCHVDLEDVIKPLHEITKVSLINDCTLLCAWSVEECARYLETIKLYENKPADSIQERTDNDYISRLTSALTCIRGVNKTDVLTLGANFGSLAALMQASATDLTKCPGIGEKKVKRLHDAFHEPFRRTARPKALLPGIGSSGAGEAAQGAESVAVVGNVQASETISFVATAGGQEPTKASPSGDGDEASKQAISVKEALALAKQKLQEEAEERNHERDQ